MKTLAERLAYAMKIRGLTQGGLSKAAGLSQPTVWRLVQGKATGSTKILSIARALSVNADWLLSGIGEMESQAQDKQQLDISVPAGAIKLPVYYPSGQATDDFIFIPKKIYSNSCVAYLLDRNTGIKEIESGTVIVVDSKEFPGNGDLVFSSGNSQLVFRFVSGGSDGFLSVDDSRVPLIDFKSIDFSGVIVFIFKSLRGKK
jgi:transcriptional regulator with XRE-family HTH domain